MSWLSSQLAPLSERGDRLAVVIDPEALLVLGDLAPYGTAHPCPDWVTLRRVYEFYGRRPAPGTRPILLVQDQAVVVSRDLPWDVEQKAVTIAIGWPVDAPWRDIIRVVDSSLADRIVDIVHDSSPEAVCSPLLSDVYGVVLPAASPADELSAVAKLRANPAVPEILWEQIRPLLTHPLARALAESPPNLAYVQQAWNEWLRVGESSAFAPVLATASSAVVRLITAGLLRPSPLRAAGLPAWASIGASSPNSRDQLEQLLGLAPGESGATAEEWMAIAAWWGDVRATLAELTFADEASATAWDRWTAIDDAFRRWLVDDYGKLLTRHAELPLTVNQIADFLRRRVINDGRRILLVVMDGMAFAQWSTLRRVLALDVVETTGCFAMCPTLTSVSRQAIFAGTWPVDFADSLWTTAREKRRWTNFWLQAGLAASDIAWIATGGSDANAVPPLPPARVIGLAVLAIDELLHGSDVNGDAQVMAGVRTWGRFGFLSSLLAAASAGGFEVWVTADHGNIEATPSGRVLEGLAVEHAGTRVRVYDTRALRDSARADGISWEPPGQPAVGKFFLFAPGRTGYHSRGAKVTHGGLSVDEVIVPFARISTG